MKRWQLCLALLLSIIVLKGCQTTAARGKLPYKIIPMASGEPIYVPDGHFVYIGCCDCGLVHRVAIVEMEGTGHQIITWRDQGRTDSLRMVKRFNKQ